MLLSYAQLRDYDFGAEFKHLELDSRECGVGPKKIVNTLELLVEGEWNCFQ